MPRPKASRARRSTSARPRAIADPARPTAGGDRTFRAFVLDQLRGLGKVESRAMFGGYGFYGDDVFFAILWRGRLYFRTGEASRARYQARGMAPFTPGPGQTLRRYYEVPPEVLEDPTETVRWARAAVSAGAAAKPRAPR